VLCTRAMVNLELSPAVVLGVGMLSGGIVLYNVRSQRPEISRDADVVISSVSVLVGGILVFQGWRLDPLLLFGQLCTSGVALAFALEVFNLRRATVKNYDAQQQGEAQQWPPPQQQQWLPPADDQRQYQQWAEEGRYVDEGQYVDAMAPLQHQQPTASGLQGGQQEYAEQPYSSGPEYGNTWQGGYADSVSSQYGVDGYANEAAQSSDQSGPTPGTDGSGSSTGNSGNSRWSGINDVEDW